MKAEREGRKWGEYPAFYHYPIDENVIPHIDDFLEDGYTKEEKKMVNETHKILDDYSIGVSPTTARVPVQGGHSESINLEFEKEFTLEDVRRLWSETEGVTVRDDPTRNIYPMPLFSLGKDDVFVGRLRRDPSVNPARISGASATTSAREPPPTPSRSPSTFCPKASCHVAESGLPAAVFDELVNRPGAEPPLDVAESVQALLYSLSARCFSQAQAEASVSSIDLSAFQPSSLLASVGSAQMAVTSPALRGANL